jgi:hypothetical protein
MKNYDWNKMWPGIILGLIVPIITYFIYYWVVSTFGLRRINISLCMIANLIPFYMSMNREHYNMTKGILLSTIVLAVVIGCLSFFTSYLNIL